MMNLIVPKQYQKEALTLRYGRLDKSFMFQIGEFLIFNLV